MHKPQSGFTPIQIVLAILAGTLVLGGIVGGVLYFSKQPSRQIQPKDKGQERGYCGDDICQDVEKERGVCSDCKVPPTQKTEEPTTEQPPTPQTEPPTQQALGDNSLDADGFLWGTETYPDKISQAKDTINKTLQVAYVKKRLQMPMVTKDGESFTAKACLPSQSNCLKQNDLDESAKLFKENNWSMVPMLSHNIDDKSIDDADIDNFVEFVDWFVSRYKNDANIKYIELINSPASWWSGTDKQLVDLMNKVYDRIKNKYPDVMIGTPGFEYWNDVAGSESGVRQLEYFLDKNNGAKFDFMAFHGYPVTIIGKGNVGYPPTSKAKYNDLAGIYGLLEIRKKLDDNGWGNRLIIDTEHTGLFATKPALSENEYVTDAAFMVQELLVKKTSRLNNKSVLSGIIPFKIAPRGKTGEFVWASLKPDGSVTPAIKAVGILLSKFNEYNYSSHISGTWDAENTPWIEKFISGSDKELYIFFKPFKYVSGKSLSLDNETVNYTLTLSKTPKSITLTDIEGNVSNVTVSKAVTLQAVNDPKYLEISY